jgi:hypothetical protein
MARRCIYTDVRFGSEADIEIRRSNVRFTPNSGHKPAISDRPPLTDAMSDFLVAVG